MNETEKKEQLFEYLALVNGIFEELKKFVVGQKTAISRVVLAYLSMGQLTPMVEGELGSGDEILGGCAHTLLEGAPGLVKTTLASILAKTCEGTFSKISCDVGLMPEHIKGEDVPIKTPGGGTILKFRLGKVYANIVLVDEVNRAGDAHGAVLEPMSSRIISVQTSTEEGKDRVFLLPNPFLVLATQNPLEERGVRDLAVAHWDRFAMKVIMANPTIEELDEIQELHEKFDQLSIKKSVTLEQIREIRKFIHREIFISPEAKRYISRLGHVLILFPFTKYERSKYEEVIRDKEFLENWKEIWTVDYEFSKEHRYGLKKLITLGPSAVRPTIFLRSIAKSLAFCRNNKKEERDKEKGFRDYALPRDVKKIAKEVLRHRVLLTNQGRILAAQYFGSRQALIDEILDRVIEKVKMPR